MTCDSRVTYGFISFPEFLAVFSVFNISKIYLSHCLSIPAKKGGRESILISYFLTIFHCIDLKLCQKINNFNMSINK